MRLKITYYLLFVVVFFFPITIYAQIADDFTDGNFTSNPTWSGNDTDFIVNTNQQLQLNSSGTSASNLIFANTQPLNNCEWTFWVHLNFSPSSSNYARIYLTSNQQNISGNLNGYYLQFGETGSNDQVELFRQSGNTSVSICRGTTNIANAFTLRVKVTRDNSGLWKLFIDPTGGTNYFQEASGTDNTFSNTSFFGVFCKYTTTNATQFFFDDFYVYAPPDIVPAILDSVNTISHNQLDVYFSETIGKTSAQTSANYSVNNNIGFASSAVRDTSNPSLVHLTFTNDFANKQNYTLTATGVQDLAGNNTLNATKNFFYFCPIANDVVINEIMEDPDPPVGLPDYEYVELFNRTSYPVRLNGWTFSTSTTTKIFPNITLLPDSFLILCKDSAANLFQSFGPTTGLFSSVYTLSNTGDNLVLRNNLGNIIQSVSYNTTWYNDPIKQNGGWSLEQIDANSSCSGKANWKASANNSGGTPGRRNSVYGSYPEVTPPKISHVTIISSNSIQLFFDEYMDSTTLMAVSNYTIDNGMGNPILADPVEPDYTSVLLTLSSSITSGIIYTVTVNGAKDCAGNTIASGNTGQFAIAQSASPNDIVINEVMFDPKVNGVEWIEIYNRSDKVIDLKEIYFCSQDDYGNLNYINQVAPGGYLILPQKYIVLSTDGSAIKSQYNTLDAEGFIDLPSIPSLNNDSDYVVLVNTSQTVIDKLHYYSSWHLPLLTDTKGISLERIDYDHPTQDASNWHSAAESVGGATPAYKNSQYTNGEEGTEVTVTPEVFSPDNDGYNDVLSINYSFDTPGMIGNVNIYDSRGRLTKTLERNELLASSGTFFWDGITDEKEKAHIGIYIVWFEAFDTKGKVKKYKKTCVVAGKL